MRTNGLKCDVVERWISFAQRNNDGGFNIIDIIALDPKKGVIGVQSTGSDFSGHDKKIMVDHKQDTG